MPRNNRKNTLSRRSVVKTIAGSLGVAAMASFSAPVFAKKRTLKVGSYGGYFEDSFKKHVYPEFTKATGIEIESVTQPNSTDWLVTMQQAAKSGAVPADLSLYGRDTMIKATRIGGLLSPLDLSRAPNTSKLDKYFLFEANAGIVGVGAMSWFTSMVVNPKATKAPASWADFWDSSKFESSLGLSKNFNANFLDITAATFFEGTKTLDTKDGIVACIEKVKEIKPNVALWWSAESQMEQAMKNEDVIGGMYYHDVASIMASEGFPIASVFPKEGNPQGYGSWCLTSNSTKADEAMEFISFSSEASTQALMSLKIGTAPLMAKEMTGLSDKEFMAVSGTPAIRPNYESYLDNETFIKDTWDKMLAAT